ncbi:MAG: ester cyclase, partial [Acidobacteriota bacterium]
NDKAWDRFAPCYAENAVSEAIDANPAMVVGRSGIIRQAQTMVAAWPDVRGDLRLVLAHGPHAVSIARWHGTHTGPLPGPDGKPVPATNKPFGFLMAHMVEFDADGRYAVRDASYVDEGTLLAQVGIVNVPARPVMSATPGPPTVVVAKGDEAEARNVAVVRRSFDAFNKHDVKAIDAKYADAYVLHEVARPEDLSRQAAAAAMAEVFKGFGDVRIMLADAFGAGDYVVVTGTLTGTNTGDLPSMGVKKSGRKVQVKFLDVFRLANGLIAEEWLFYNGAAFSAQLGAS